MALLRARDLSLTYVDDQSSTLWNRYVGNWTKYVDGNTTKYYDGTYTATSTPGDSFSFTFTGTQLWIFGGLFNANVSQDGRFISYPTADYLVDGNPVGPQVPFFNAKSIVYFRTDDLQDGLHTVNLTVTAANQTNPFIIDVCAYYFVAGTTSSSSPISTSTGNPPTSSPTSSPAPPPVHPDHVGAIVGGVIGGFIAITILILGLLYFLRKRARGDQVDYPERPNPIYAVTDTYPTEPFDLTSDGYQPTNTDNSNTLLDPSLRLSGVDSRPGGMMQPSIGKAPLIAHSSGNVQRPVQYDDSGIRFGTREGQVPARPQSPPEVPPRYTQG